MIVNGETQLIGLIGWPVAHSLSPTMHNAALAAMGLNWLYVPLPVQPEHVGDAIRGLPALGFRGANVTVPHKQAVMPYLDTIALAASAIGAVNTILVEQEPDDRLSGDNTDWRGFLADLMAQGIAIAGRDCLVLGAGGSARAVVYALGQAGGRVSIAARRTEQARQLANDMGAHSVNAIWSLGELPTAAARLDRPLIVNTTPLGMPPYAEQSAWPDDLPFPRDSFAYDLVYNPAETRFMRQAAFSGCKASNGLGMLLRQGAAALTLWTGLEPDLGVMNRAIFP
jgi:shikimate dehydrogenase